MKLTDAGLTDRAALEQRMLLVEALAADTEMVVSPLRIDDRLVQTTDEWLVTATPFVIGRGPDVSATADARLLGTALGGLHVRLGEVPAHSLPPVAALDVDDGTDRSGWQAVHGDFSDHNVIVTSSGPRVLDFDDCGFAPALYDVANSLYMVLFDAEVHAGRDRYSIFRTPFLAGYADATGQAVDEVAVDELIEVRIDALGRWLDDLGSAPIGIRTSSPEWQATLRTFVSSSDARR